MSNSTLTVSFETHTQTYRSRLRYRDTYHILYVESDCSATFIRNSDDDHLAIATLRERSLRPFPYDFRKTEQKVEKLTHSELYGHLSTCGKCFLGVRNFRRKFI